MSDPEQGEPALSEVTGTFHYQELIESRLGQPIAANLTEAEVQRQAASPGARLAAARQASGWSVEQVAAQLKMATRQIVALENDDYTALPETAIVKGFTRAYAKLLKLDPAPLLALLATDIADKKSLPGETAIRPGNISADTPGKEIKKKPVLSPALVIFLCMAAGLAYLYYHLQH